MFNTNNKIIHFNLFNLNSKTIKLIDTVQTTTTINRKTIEGYILWWEYITFTTDILQQVEWRSIDENKTVVN